MVKIQYIGTYPMEVLMNPGDVTGVHVRPGGFVEVPDERVADFLRRTEQFAPVAKDPPAVELPAEQPAAEPRRRTREG